MATVVEYECPCCGGALSFDSGVQKLKCPYCDTEFDVQAVQGAADDRREDAADEWNWDTAEKADWQTESDGVCTYVCRSCGGAIVGDSTTAATLCPFCGGSVVIADKLSGQWRPDCVIPFKLDKEAAKQALQAHLKRKRLLPRAFVTEQHIDEVRGVYVPFWLFDAEAHARIRYRATKVRTWRAGDYRYTETSYFSVVRAGNLAFADVPADGSRRMADELTESIEPFDCRAAQPFQAGYLAGYVANAYDVSAAEVLPRVNERVKTSTEQAFAGTVMGYSTVTPEHSSVQIQRNRVRYALLPVWILNTRWKDQPYTFAMNGQTGKLVGNLPLDRAAYWKWWGLVAGLTAAVLFGLLMCLSRL